MKVYKKVVYMKDKKESDNKNFKYQVPYVRCINGKWIEDLFYFNNEQEFLNDKIKQGFLIQ